MSNDTDRQWRREHPVATRLLFVLGMALNLLFWAFVILLVTRMLGLW